VKEGIRWSLAFLLFVVLAALPVSAQEQEETKRLEIVYGPRVGVTWVTTSRQDFDAGIQGVFPADREYFPIFTQFGFNLEQRIRLGNTQSHFAFQEVLILGGLDQNIILPSLSVMIGFRSRIGLEFGLGPNMAMKRSPEGAGIDLSVAYSLGWTFSFEDVFVPVDLAVIPTPSDGNPRITLLTGFNFKKR
jgi:hypothetical protein